MRACREYAVGKMPSVIVRAAAAAELELVGSMRVAFLADADGRPQPDDLADVTLAFLQARQDADELRSWLAFDEDRCVGIVSLLLAHVPPRLADRTTREGYVVNMYVAPSHRRRGLARQLLDACIAGAHELQLRRLYLYATDEGRPLYERSGFAPHPAWMHLPIAGS